MPHSTPRLVIGAEWTLRRGPRAIQAAQRRRLAEVVAYARSHSPLYRELFRGLPDVVHDVTTLPVTDKPMLMARFDEWTTDRAVTAAAVREFVARPERVGEWFLDRYTIATTSGTTGRPGIFLVDRGSFRVAAAMGARMLLRWLTVSDVVRVVRGGRRLAMVNAMGGHVASAIAATRLRRASPERVAVFPVDAPLEDIVAGLAKFRPMVLAPYASVGALLASEQQAGRLDIAPVLVVLSAEGLPLAEHARIARAFGTIVRDSYAATECPFLSYRCAEGWLHVNADWAVLEPVDAERRPVPPGVQSHTVLLTNLANRVQPILRYDLGDSVVQRADLCSCGSPLPAIRVQGRAADVLVLRARRGGTVSVPPLLIDALVDSVAGVEQVQVVQRAEARLEVRVRPSLGADGAAVVAATVEHLKQLLDRQGVGDVAVEASPERPLQTAGGKLRPVIPISTSNGAVPTRSGCSMVDPPP